MRLVLVDSPEEVRGNFYPLALSRPLWEFRCGFTSLGEKLIAKVGVSDAAYFVADYMADAYGAKARRPVNDSSVLDGDDLLIVDPRVKADSFDAAEPGSILQRALYGDGARNYRIDMAGKLYITNFKTKKQPAEYVVEIWRTSKNFLVGSFTFETVK